MASLYPNTTTEGYEHFRNDSMINSVRSHLDMLYFIMFTVVGGPMCIVGFVANIICYNVLKKDSGKKHHAATFLLQALAMADNFLLTIFIGFSIIVGLLPILGERGTTRYRVLCAFFCVYIGPFGSLAMTVTVWITVLIAINRYIAVCRPLDAHRLASLKRTKIQVAVVVTLAIIFNLPRFFQYTIVYREDRDSNSWPTLRQTSIGPSSVLGMVYAIGLTIGLLIFPLILLIILNTKIICKLRKVDKWKDIVRQNGSRSENNITLVMVVIIIVFIVCNIPDQIYSVAFKYIKSYNYCGNVFWSVSQVLVAASSSTNFLVYYVLRKSFRQSFRKALCCCQPHPVVV